VDQCPGPDSAIVLIRTSLLTTVKKFIMVDMVLSSMRAKNTLHWVGHGGGVGVGVFTPSSLLEGCHIGYR
jgi:hypothetical protein